MKKVKKQNNSSPEGLNQSFVNSKKKRVTLKSILKEGDWWELKSGKRLSLIITHDAVKRIADEAGVLTDVTYSILTQPDVRNNYQNTWQVKICDGTGRCTTEIGESNRGNLGPRGRNNPANMAQKRAYDRAVFRHLGIVGILSDEELPDEEDTKKEMDKLSYDEQKVIAPLINEIINAKSQKDLATFKDKMKKESTKYTETQLFVLRNLWKKTFANLEKSF